MAIRRKYTRGFKQETDRETKAAEMRQHYASGLAKSPMETGVKTPPHLCRIPWLAQDSSR